VSSGLIIAFLYIAAGFILLYYGGDWLIIGAVRLAVKLNVSPVLVALTVVAFGTSLPEFLVSGLSACTGHPVIAVGNILGSNICNICLVAGACAMIANPMKGDKIVASRDMWMLVISTGMFWFLGKDLLFSFSDGILLITLFVGYITYLVYSELRGRKAPKKKAPSVKESGVTSAKEIDPSNELEDESHLAVGEDLLEEFVDDSDSVGCYRYILAGLIMLPAGAHLLVIGGIDLARILGISERFISMTVVSWGTSLPEFATSVAAAMRGHSAMCVGNVVGSNIFNTLMIGGVTSLFVSIKFASVALKVDFILVCIATIVFAFLHRKGKEISRIEGAFMLSGFLVMLYLLQY